ncbi:DUF982 domain-containing protein [Mesorhizobium sp. M0028]|uniref:DUF982 domain-containing protein n=1 Tax=Mesorhizobium sp. M0028 TaxID=2956849 RepID=UPI003334D873
MLWFAPVRIKSAPGRMLEVKSVETALEQMRQWVDWPVPDKLAAAYVVCARAIDNPTPEAIAEARQAFVEAAREAKVLREG